MRSQTRTLLECAILLSLSIALSFIRLWRMPLGGSVTPASMLPVMLVSLKYGGKRGLSVSFLYSLFQLSQALIEGNVFPYCETTSTLIACILFDYLLPFTFLGLCGFFSKNRRGETVLLRAYLGISISIVLRFICHFISGFYIWGQWVDDMSPYLYSFLYNGGFLLPELVLCILITTFLLKVPGIQKLLNIDPVSSDKTNG